MSTSAPDPEHERPEPEPEDPETMPDEGGVTPPEPGMLPERVTRVLSLTVPRSVERRRCQPRSRGISTSSPDRPRQQKVRDESGYS